VGQFVDGVFNVEGIGAGSYNWTVVDANGCSDIVAFELTEPDVLEAALEIEGEILCNGDVGDALLRQLAALHHTCSMMAKPL
jgi:hypothetical protein